MNGYTCRNDNEVSSPGSYIRGSMKARCWTLSQLADMMDYGQLMILDVLQGNRPITPELAESLGKAFETGAQFWLNLEAAYRDKKGGA